MAAYCAKRRSTMTLIEALNTVLSLAKAEYDNSVEECAYNVEALEDMDEAITMVDGWLTEIKLGVSSGFEDTSARISPERLAEFMEEIKSTLLEDKPHG